MYKILIQPLEKKDALISWRWRNDSDIWEFTGSKPDIKITPEIEINWIEKILLDPNSKRFAITVDDIYIGNIQLTNITNTDAEYHIFIGEKNYWGKGIAFFATQQIIRFAKNSLLLDNIYLKVGPDNLKAIRLYKKSGFEVVSDEVKMVLSLKKPLRPMVSIFCMVYNHESYLHECLEGFLMQNCNFDFEIVIGEDCSTDNSRAILLEYAQKYPGKFRLLLHKKNVGAYQNQNLVLENCTGKYIAMCEGDDYWTDSLKLQKQVAFLENNKGYVLSFHDAVESKGNDIIYNNNENDLCEEDLILNSHLHTSTVLFRWKEEINKKLKSITVVNGDTALYSVLGHFGKGKYIKDISPSTYRIHDRGVWSGKSMDFRLISAIETYKWILLNSDIKYHNALREKILKKSVSLAIIQNSSKNWRSLNKNFYTIIVLSLETGKYRYLLYLFKKIIGI